MTIVLLADGASSAAESADQDDQVVAPSTITVISSNYGCIWSKDMVLYVALRNKSPPKWQFQR